MFEKLLSVGDVDNNYGSIVIPKKYAEVRLIDYFISTTIAF